MNCPRCNHDHHVHAARYLRVCMVRDCYCVERLIVGKINHLTGVAVGSFVAGALISTLVFSIGIWILHR